MNLIRTRNAPDPRTSQGARGREHHMTVSRRRGCTENPIVPNGRNVTRTRETGWYHRQGGSQQIRRKAGAAGGYRTYDLSLTKGVSFEYQEIRLSCAALVPAWCQPKNSWIAASCPAGS